MAPEASAPAAPPLTMSQMDWEIRAGGIGLEGFDQGQLARWFLDEALALRTRLNDEITRRGSTIGCAFCFQQYPAGDTWDDEAMIAATRKHVADCSKHPAAEFRQQRDAAESRSRALEELIQHTAESLRIGADLARGKDRDGLLALATAMTDRLATLDASAGPSTPEDLRWLVERLGQLYACGLEPEEGERERFEAIKARLEGSGA